MEIRIRLDSIAQHRIRVEVAVRCPSDAGAVEFLMPVWTPGSYLVREYPRHILAIDAVDGVAGIELPIAKTAKNRYRVEAAEGVERVIVRYTVYAHSLTVREAWVGEEFAYWNGACVYLWPVEDLDAVAKVKVELPPSWTLYAGAKITTGEFEVAGLDAAVDTPCLATRDAEIVEFEVLDATVRFVCAGLAGIKPPASLAPHARSVIEHAAAVFGGQLPLSEYSFLSLFGESGRGGLEHLDSSTLLAPRTTFGPPTEYADFLSLVAHEFFHIWNVKRLRPADFMKFDYEREQHTRLLWVAEGVTSYYDDHLCLRAGIVDARAYLETLAGHVRSMHRTPGRFVQSLSEASFDAWIRFYRPDENTRNATQNYYSGGALVAIVIDAWIRDGSDGSKCLDDVMARLYATKCDTGYETGDVIEVVSAMAGRDVEFELRSLVEGDLQPDLEATFGVYGLALRRDAEQPTIGVQLRRGETTIATVIDDTPASRAGLSPGDEVLAMAGLRVTAQSWATLFAQVAHVGVPLELLVSRHGRIVVCRVEPVLEVGTRVQIQPLAEATDRQVRLREQWLGPSAAALDQSRDSSAVASQ